MIFFKLSIFMVKDFQIKSLAGAICINYSHLCLGIASKDL